MKCYLVLMNELYGPHLKRKKKWICNWKVCWNHMFLRLRLKLNAQFDLVSFCSASFLLCFFLTNHGSIYYYNTSFACLSFSHMQKPNLIAFGIWNCANCLLRFEWNALVFILLRINIWFTSRNDQIQSESKFSLFIQLKTKRILNAIRLKRCFIFISLVYGALHEAKPKLVSVSSELVLFDFSFYYFRFYFLIDCTKS